MTDRQALAVAVVDDHAPTLQMICIMVQSLAYQAVPFASAAAALVCRGLSLTVLRKLTKPVAGDEQAMLLKPGAAPTARHRVSIAGLPLDGP